MAVSGKWPKVAGAALDTAEFGRVKEVVLTSGGAFTGKSVELADVHPSWAKSVRVNENGEIVLQVKPLIGLAVFIK